MFKKIKSICLILTICILTSAYGYMGELPDLNEYFKDRRIQNVNEKTQNENTTKEEKEINLKDLIPAPSSDLYLQIMGDKTKETSYLIDMRDLKNLLIRFNSVLEGKCTLQTYSSYASMYDLNVRYIIEKYGNKKEAYTPSYRSVITLNSNVLAVKKQWKTYEDNNRYIPRTFMSTKSGNEISSHLRNLKKDINNTIYELNKK